MKPREIAEPAAISRLEIAEFIARDGNFEKAESYLETTLQTLLRFDETLLPKRAHPRLPEYVYQATVPGFAGYVLWIAVTDDAIVLVAAFRPGLTRSQQAERGQEGVDGL